ncbi:MAG: restriction endonuclease subunit S [Phycisphaeraceae bacterium]|nr:restriction endonuclease subunit S [Phycisphaeraceae bacterium]
MKVVAPREEKIERRGRAEDAGLRFMRADECLDEVWQGIGPAWNGRPLYGASRSGLTPAKEAIGKHPERYKAVESGTVFYNPMRILLGSIAMLDDGEAPGITSPDYVVVRGRPGVLHHRVFYYWLRSAAGEQLIRDLARGGVRERILFNRLCEGRIPVPPWNVQERLAEQLAIVPVARRAALDRLAAAEALPAALLREVFEGPQASGWETRTIGEFARTCSGATPSRGNAAYFGGGIPWVKTGELRDGFVGDDGSTEESVTEAALRDCSLPLLPPGTLLIAMYGQGKTRGRTGILTREATTNQACFAILPAPDVFDTGFLQLWFRANYNDLRALTENRGGNQPNLNGVLLRELEIPLPDPTSQRHLAAELTEKLAAAEGVIARCREELAAIEALPAALLRGAFGGNDNGW